MRPAGVPDHAEWNAAESEWELGAKGDGHPIGAWTWWRGDGTRVCESLFDDGFSSVNRNGESTGAGHSGTQKVFWNVRGKGTVRSLQFGWGYVIGPAGVSIVTESLLPMGVGTEPFDRVEGPERGADLLPTSLYADQRQRRLGGR